MNQRYWSSRIQGLVPYTPGEQPKDRTFIKLNTNENPYPPSPRVLEAIRREADQRLRLYPDPESACLRAQPPAATKIHPQRNEKPPRHTPQGDTFHLLEAAAFSGYNRFCSLRMQVK